MLTRERGPAASRWQARPVEGALLAVVGVIAGRCVLSGESLRFVRAGVRWELLACSAVLLLIGAHAVLDSGTTPAEALAHDPGRGGFGLGVLLLLPFLVVAVVVPPAPGAYAAAADSGAVRRPTGRLVLPPLPATASSALAGQEAVLDTLADYSLRAVYGRGETLRGRRVRLVGFASPRVRGDPAGGWLLTRMVITCCAADATAVKVDLVLPRPVASVPDDTWVEVTGTWLPSIQPTDSPATLARLRVDPLPEGLRQVVEPADPYE